MISVAAPILGIHAAGIVALATLTDLAASTLLFFGVFALAGAALGGSYAYRAGARVADRIAKTVHVLQRVQDGNYLLQLDVEDADEFGLLADRVNRLVTAAGAREKRLIGNALVDPLTGLHNRALLADRIRAAIAASQRTRAEFAIAVLDLDRFKMVNDTLGHAVGDRLLKEVATRLKRTVREYDTVARLGGDEFVLLLGGGSDIALEVTDRILGAMSSPFESDGQVIDIGVSIGIAMYPEHGQDDASLLRRADAAMYRAKRHRTGRCLFDGDTTQTQRSMLSMVGEMRTALSNGQFELEYQPQMSAKTGRITGLEGLLRWTHPTRGLLTPNDFIPFAEQTGFMRELTTWVLAEGTRFASELARDGIDVRLSLNVAAADIESVEFFATVRTVLEASGLDSKRLCLEITESGVVSETETALHNLRRIAALGVRLSVDDFGTGYATLTQLQRLPVHELKIDRSFVTGMHESRGNESIVRTTIDLAKQLGLSVVAEGVETTKELRALHALGCDEVQGYLLSKPLPPEQVAPWISIRNTQLDALRQRKAGNLRVA